MSIIASKGNSATVTFTNPQEIIISHADDSIKIGDGTDLLAINADGSINVVQAAGGATSANQATEIARLDSLVAKDFATQTTLASILTDLQAKADLAETQPVSVAGVSTAAKQDLLLTELQLKADLTETQPVSLATLPALVAGSANIGDVDVLTLPSIPAGSNNIGDVDVLTLPALSAGSNNIGDVDVLTLPALVTGSAIIGRVGIDQTTPGTTNKVSIGTDGTVALNAAIPTGANVIGQVTANAGTNLNTSLLNLESTQVLIKAKTDNIDVALSTRTKPSDLQLVDNRRVQTILFANINVNTSGDNTIIAADATKKIKVLQYTLIVSNQAISIIWKSGASNISGIMPIGANGGIASPFVPASAGHLIETTVNNALILNLSISQQVGGHLTYILEA